MALCDIMPAQLLFRERIGFPDGALVEMVVWQVPEPVRPSEHSFKYSLVYIVNGVRVLGYDNERGKGDHRHVAEREEPIAFISIRDLVQRFRTEVLQLRGTEP